MIAIMNHCLTACLLSICLIEVVLAGKLFDGNPQASFDNDPRYDTSWMELDAKLHSQDRRLLDPEETLNILKTLEGKYKILIRLKEMRLSRVC